MFSCKIRKSQRNRKRQNQKTRTQYNNITPPKYIMKNSVVNTVSRLEKKFGYKFDCTEDQLDPRLRQMRQQFQDKAVKYCGGSTFAKKQTRFDKMRMKEQMGFKLEELPIKKQLKKADKIIENLMKKQALFALLKCK